MDDTQETKPSFNVEVTQKAQSESRDVVARGLREFNARHLGDYPWTDLDVYVRDGEGRVIGGLIGDVALDWFSNSRLVG